jgi:hypothetical protein
MRARKLLNPSWKLLNSFSPALPPLLLVLAPSLLFSWAVVLPAPVLLLSLVLLPPSPLLLLLLSLLVLPPACCSCWAPDAAKPVPDGLGAVKFDVASAAAPAWPVLLAGPCGCSTDERQGQCLLVAV